MPLPISTIILTAAFALASTGIAAAATASVATNMKLREGPGTHHRPVATMPVGDAVDVIACEGMWCEIDWRGRSGFANRSYLAYGYKGRRSHRSVPLVIVPPPSPPHGPVVYSVPYPDPAISYRRATRIGMGTGF